MFRTLTHISSALCLLAAVAVAQSPKTFKFVAINFPGASATQANGINNHNQIVGSFETGAGCNPTFENCPDHGFRLVSGRFTRFDVSGAVSTSIHGVNDFGDIVGSYRTKDNKTHGFLRLHTGKFTTLNFPDGRDTVAMAVNNSLIVVGTATDGFHGFVWKNGKFTQWDIPGGSETQNLGISNNGIVVGQVFAFDFWNGFLKAATDVDIFPRFNPPNFDCDNFTTGINNRVDIVGWCAEENSGYFAPTVEANEGSPEKEKAPAYVRVAFPNALTTMPSSINYARAIVGSYQDQSGKFHGFMASPQ